MMCYDVLVVGGGVIGAAIARELSASGLTVVLCEKEEDLLSGASSGNSGHVASNFYYSSSRAPLEAELSAKARIINKQWIDSQPAVPCSRKTMLYLARGEEEEASLRNIMELGKVNNVAGIRKVSLAEVEELEPHLCMDGITGALLSDNEAIVDPWLLAMTHVYGMEVAGVDILTGCEVLGMTRDQGRWSVNTVKGTMMARVVINCGGNHGDKVEEMLEQESPFTIVPGRGEYIVYPPSPVTRPVVPVPGKQSAGLYVFITPYGHTVVGPTNIPQQDRADTTVSPTSITTLTTHLFSLFPCMMSSQPLGLYAGLRPATQHQDYVVRIQLDRGWITVGGIRSTGLTCSLALSQYIAKAVVPNYIPSTLPTMPQPQVEGDKVRIGKKLYRPTHPLTRLGLLGADLPQKFVNQSKL